MADIFADGPKFAMMPEWVLDSDISAQAVRLFGVLHRYADEATKLAHPGRRILAARLKVKDLKVVDRAVADLVRIGAVEVFPRWRSIAGETSLELTRECCIRTSSGYRLHLWKPCA